jgi:NNP family nitrate/nitrite transporter-like MFS transporter
MNESVGSRRRVLWLSTIAFTLLFNVWLMLGVLGIKLRSDNIVTDGQLEWLIACAILSGSLLRLHFGIWTDCYGGRAMILALLLFTVIPTYLFCFVDTFPALLIVTLLFGLAGKVSTKQNK